ncbi:MAG: sulfurtransferase [Bacteroidota bacterium]|nr:sulfurtransferase [Bacteroidota bacterium]
MPKTEHLSPLIEPDALKEILGDLDVRIVDCRFDLADPHLGHQAWLTSRIPGAFYAHLDDDLSSPVGDGTRGRHPLPSPSEIFDLLEGWGVSEEVLLVIYDDSGGAFASRLWWMTRWLGHEGVCVLNGGWSAWQRSGGIVDTDEPVPTAPASNSKREKTITLPWVAEADDLHKPGVLLVDSRASERYEGRSEPIDPVAGHVPGAVNLPWMENLGPDGNFLSKERLLSRWEGLGDPISAICYCGSGVTACHNILAAAVAGLPIPRLYSPSWSGWISDPSRPIVTGSDNTDPL